MTAPALWWEVPTPSSLHQPLGPNRKENAMDNGQEPKVTVRPLPHMSEATWKNKRLNQLVSIFQMSAAVSPQAAITTILQKSVDYEWAMKQAIEASDCIYEQLEATEIPDAEMKEVLMSAVTQPELKKLLGWKD